MTDSTHIPPFAPADRAEPIDRSRVGADAPDAHAGASDGPSVSETLWRAAGQVRDVWQAGHQPGMPLSVISNVAREAPLASLLCAFLLGVAVARRR